MTTQENTEWMIWPDGTMAEIDDIRCSDFGFMSDDYRLATDEEVAEYFGETPTKKERPEPTDEELTEFRTQYGNNISWD